MSSTNISEPEATRVLIVEDEPLIAMTLEDVLVDAGFIVACMAGRLEKALELIATARFDIAIVDANLAGVSAGPAVTALRARGVPFIVLSGYSLDQLPGAFLGARFMRKPFIADRLIHCLKSVLVS